MSIYDSTFKTRCLISSSVRWKKIFMIFLLLANMLVSAQNTVLDNIPSNVAHIDIILLMGQSNMKGRGEVPTDQATNDHIISMNMTDDTWYTAEHPLHTDGVPDLIDQSSNAGVGPGLDFALEVSASDPTALVALIPLAVGGSQIGLWLPGTDFYTNTIRRVEIALADFPDNLEVSVKAVLWLQGESDSRSIPAYQAYKNKLTQVINGLRSDIGNPKLPFISATIGSFIEEKTSSYPYYGEINKILLNTDQSFQYYSCVDTASFGNSIGDFLHYDTPSQKLIGQLMAKAYLTLSIPKKNILIDGATNELFLYDGIEGAVLSNTNGTGWSGPWSQTSGSGIRNDVSSLIYPTGSGSAVHGTAMTASGTNSIIRSFTNTYEMYGSKFYLSYLVQKSGDSEFTIKGYGGDNLRYGMQITKGGSIRVRASQHYGELATGAMEDNITYLVVLHKNSTTSSVAIFKQGDAIPTYPSNVSWIATHTAATGVDLDRLDFEFEGTGTFTIDEIRLGSTFQSVTKGDGKNYILAVEKTEKLAFESYPNPATDRLFITTPNLKFQNVAVEIFEANGSSILAKEILVNENTISVDISFLSQGIYIVRLESDTANYSKKIIVN